MYAIQHNADSISHYPCRNHGAVASLLDWPRMLLKLDIGHHGRHVRLLGKLLLENFHC